MSSVDDFIAAIDKFVLMDKQLIGADDYLSWQPGRDPETDYLKLPLEVDREQLGQFLFVTSHPNHHTLRFYIGITYEPTICRIDYHVEAVHPNGLSAEREGLPPIVRGPHYHSWKANKMFVEAVHTLPRLRRAEPFNAAHSFDSTLRWFCAENKIHLPPRHTIELPPRRKLL